MRLFFTLFLFLIIFSSSAQRKKQSAFTFEYTYQLPFGDLSKRFGNNSSVGCSFFSERENNFFYKIQSNYLFGNKVNDSTIFDKIRTSNGALIAADGHYANVNLMQRGYSVILMAGYALHTKKNDLSGLYLSAGIGFLQHQIFIDTKNENIPQLNEEYKKGYDRLTNGLSTKWEANYKYYSPDGNFQIYTGMNITLAYTENKRPYLFDTMEYTTNKRSWDKLLGINMGIIIPVHRKNEEEFHYF